MNYVIFPTIIKTSNDGRIPQTRINSNVNGILLSILRYSSHQKDSLHFHNTPVAVRQTQRKTESSSLCSNLCFTYSCNTLLPYSTYFGHPDHTYGFTFDSTEFLCVSGVYQVYLLHWSGKSLRKTLGFALGICHLILEFGYQVILTVAKTGTPVFGPEIFSMEL